MKNSKIEIKTANITDDEYIADIHKESWLSTDSYLELFWKDAIIERFEKNKEKRIENIKKSILDWRYIIAQKWHNIAGFVWFHIDEKQDINPNLKLVTWAIYILKEYQNMWIWKLLMNKLFEILKERSIDWLYFHVLDTNIQARMFYEKIWWKLLDTVKEDIICNKKCTEVAYLRTW